MGQKSWPRPLRLSVYIFKMSQPICVIFGTSLEHCFILNTSVNPILKEFITQMVLPSNKINNSVFHLQNQMRTLHLNVHVFKIPIPICTIFGRIEQCDILNMPVTSFLSTA